MGDRPPFDGTKYAFMLVAFILIVYVILAVAGAASCLVYMHTIITDPAITCDPKNRLTDLLTAALAAALSLYAGLSKKG